jgi:hypothetical protein
VEVGEEGVREGIGLFPKLPGIGFSRVEGVLEGRRRGQPGSEEPRRTGGTRDVGTGVKESRHCQAV